MHGRSVQPFVHPNDIHVWIVHQIGCEVQCRQTVQGAGLTEGYELGKYKAVSQSQRSRVEELDGFRKLRLSCMMAAEESRGVYEHS